MQSLRRALGSSFFGASCTKTFTTWAGTGSFVTFFFGTLSYFSVFFPTLPASLLFYQCFCLVNFLSFKTFWSPAFKLYSLPLNATRQEPTCCVPASMGLNSSSWKVLKQQLLRRTTVIICASPSLLYHALRLLRSSSSAFTTAEKVGINHLPCRLSES